MKINDTIYNAFEGTIDNMINFIHDKNLYKDMELEYSTYHFDQKKDKPIALFLSRYLRHHSVLFNNINEHRLTVRINTFFNKQSLLESALNSDNNKEQRIFIEDLTHLDDFITEEKEIINKCKHTETIKTYLEQISLIENNKERIKAFINKDFKYDNALDFSKFAKDRLNSNIINLEEMAAAVNSLISKADQVYFKKLLGLSVNNELIEEYLGYYFDFKQYKRPLILEQYPDILRDYKVMLKAWLLKETYKRINKLQLDSNDLPEEYEIIKKYAEELLDPAEKKYLDENQKPLIDYPEHIFYDQKGYALFKAYNKYSLNKNAELGFLYYHMKDFEKDTDFKIKAAPRDFTDWYLSEEDSNKELELKKDSKAFTDERQNIYNMIKSFIIDKYNNA